MHKGYNILRSFAGFMALLVLLGSVNLTIDMHFCQDNLRSFNFFGKAKNCHELAKDMASCPNHQSNNDDTEACAEGIKDCCHNKTIELESNLDDQLVDFNYLDIDSNKDINVIKVNPLFGMFKLASESILYRHYKPPLIQKDIPVLFESFLL